MTSTNKRIFYASQSIHLQPVSTGVNGNHRTPSEYFRYGDGGNESTTTNSDPGKWIYPRGLQSAGISTTFNTSPVSQLGTLQIYSQTESVPQVEVTLNKVLDGTAPLYCLCTSSIDSSDHDVLYGINKDLTEVTNNMVNVRLAVFSDTTTLATGATESHTYCNNMYLSRVTYTFPVEGAATEAVTLLGSSKTWATGAFIPAIPDDPATSGNEANYPQGLGASYVVRRQHIALQATGLGDTYPPRGANGKILLNGIAGSVLEKASILPTGFGGIPVNSSETVGFFKVPIIQNITISADLGRENINELGYFGPYFKYTTFPIEVTSEFQVVSTYGDLIDANDFNDVVGCTGSSYANLSPQEIVIKVCGTSAGDALYIDLGQKNKLTSVNYAGGDTGGGNTTTTYSFQTFNKLNIIPSGAYAVYKSFTDSVSLDQADSDSPTVAFLQ
jgi:hypothetical protein